MITPDQAQRLERLDEFVTRNERAGKTRRQFWDEFWVEAATLEAEAKAAGHESDLAIALYEIVDTAHEGYTGNPAAIDEVMEG